MPSSLTPEAIQRIKLEAIRYIAHVLTAMTIVTVTWLLGASVGMIPGAFIGLSIYILRTVQSELAYDTFRDYVDTAFWMIGGGFAGYWCV